MKLTYATEQAVAVMALLATQTKDSLLSSEAITKKLVISKSYVQKLLRKLVVAQLIEGVSGSSGGFFIKKPLTDISLYEVVEAIEGEFHSFPEHDVLQTAFSAFDTTAHEGHKIIASFFSEADSKWSDYLKSISVEKVLLKVFIEEKTIPTHDWNVE